MNRTAARSAGIAADIAYGAAMGDTTAIRRADFSELTGCSVILLTAGVNEKTGGATDRTDTEGRLTHLAATRKSTRIYSQCRGRRAECSYYCRPPDPLTDVARALAGHERVFGAGTFIDSLRFRTHLGRHSALPQVPWMAHSDR